MERPAIRQVLELARNNQVQCIIVKDFSRFARNYIEMGTYLEQIFPFLGVRFISISDHYDSKDFAELLGVSVKTLQRWDREGTLKANRTPTDRRYYTYDQYLQFKGINTEDDQRQVVIYARVSTRNQKDDLQNQVAFLRQFCNAKGIIVDQCIEDYGSGLNYNRKKWNQLLDEVMEQKIKTIIVTHKDRFIRFGYDWFEKICTKFNTTIMVVNNEELSPQEELVQDIVSILHVFSCRLYGLRKYKKQIERDVEIAKELQNGNKSDRGAES